MQWPVSESCVSTGGHGSFSKTMTRNTLQKALRNGYKKCWRVLRWPAMSPDLNPIEHLWRDLQTAVGRRHPSNRKALEQFAKEEWSKIPVEKCKKLILGYRNRIQLFFPKGVLPNIKLRVPIILASAFLGFCVGLHQISLFFS